MKGRKRWALVSLFMVLLAFGCKAQQSTVEEKVAERVDALVKGMISKDKSLLDDLTAEELVYGHSGGKVQNKAEFIAEILSGDPLEYKQIGLLDQTVKVVGNTAIVRHTFTAETRSKSGESGSLKIGNVLIWQLQKGVWKLLVRQAYRLPS